MTRLSSFSLLRISLVVGAVGMSMTAPRATAQDDAATKADASAAEDTGYLNDPDAVAAFEKGETLLGEEKFPEALNAFNEAIALQRDLVEAYIGKGQALLGMEEYDAAKDVFKNAIDYGARSAVAYNGRGEAYLELGQSDLAFKDFSNALDLDRNNAKVLANIGHVKANYEGDPVAALRYLDDAIALDGSNARSYRDRGLAHAGLQEYDEAVADLKKAGEVEPNNHENFSTLAQVYLIEEDYEEAIKALTQAIEAYEPKERTDLEVYVDGYLLRANIRLKLGDSHMESDKAAAQAAYDAAIADTQLILDAYPERFPHAGFAHYRRALAERLLGQYSEAIKSFTAAIQNVPRGGQAPYLADAYLRRGICWHYQGYEDLARGDFEEAASVDFLDPKPNFWMGLTYASEGKYREAIIKYSEAVTKDPSFPLAYVNRGLAYYQLQDYERAITSFNDAIRSEPTEAEHYYKRGVTHMKLDQHMKAVNSFRSALLYSPNMAKAQKKMGESQQALGNPNLANQYEIQAGE